MIALLDEHTDDYARAAMRLDAQRVVLGETLTHDGRRCYLARLYTDARGNEVSVYLTDEEILSFAHAVLP